MNFILANCKQGQKKIGVECSPQILYKNLLKYINKDLSQNINVHHKFFNNNEGYNMIYNLYNNYNIINDNPVITLGGDHSVSIGSCQAFIDKYKDDAHIIWIDAHTDINTYKTSDSGNIHGMVVSQLMGFDDPLILNKQYNLKPEQITYLGPRSIDEGEQKIIDEHNIKIYSCENIKKLGIFYILQEIQEKIKKKKIHISFDIDVFDPYYVQSTGTVVENGLNPFEIYTILKYICQNNPISSCDFVEFNPLLSDQKNMVKTLLYMNKSMEHVLKNI